MPDSQPEISSSPYGYHVTLTMSVADATSVPLIHSSATIVATIPLGGDLDSVMDDVRQSVDRLLLLNQPQEDPL